MARDRLVMDGTEEKAVSRVELHRSGPGVGHPSAESHADTTSPAPAHSSLHPLRSRLPLLKAVHESAARIVFLRAGLALAVGFVGLREVHECPA